MICPFATFRPVSNQGGPMAQVHGLVLHVQEGNGSLYGYFNNPNSQVSAHFWCAKDGTLEQYVDTNRIAWAEVAGNPNYLSVETEGFDGEPLTAQQIAKVAQLLLWSASQYGFPLTGPVPHGTPGFTPHCNPDGTPDPAWGNHPCPGSIRLGQMPEIIAAATPTGKEEEMTHWTSGGQDHIAGDIPGVGPCHWWQQTPTGDPNHPADPTWHVERLPLP